MEKILSRRSLIFGMVIAAAVAAFFFLISPSETLVQKVGRLVELPQGETPTVVMVANKERLIGQPFFLKAQNGDKVLIYPKNREAILYRPNDDKVIEVGAVSAENGFSQPAASASAAGR